MIDLWSAEPYNTHHMKRLELIFTCLQLPIDYCLLLLAGVSAYNLRFAKVVRAVRPVLFNLSWHRFWPALFSVALGWIIIFALIGLYSTDPNRKLARDLARIFLACSTGFAGITIYVFFTLQKFDSRFLVLAGWILAILYISVGRIMMKGLKSWLYRLGLGLRRTVIIGEESVAKTIAENLTAKPALGYLIVGTIPHFNPSVAQKLIADLPDEIIFTNPKASEAEVLSAVDFANTHHLVFKYSADLFATISTNMAISTIAGIPIIELRRTKLFGWGGIVKRLMDIIFGSLFLIILSPVWLIVAIGILLESGRPIIYKNERVGRFGKKFVVLKFRSMHQNASTGSQFGVAGEKALAAEAELIKKQNGKTGPVYKIVNDPRVTPFGRFLRRWSLDELPQFINVIKGDMSLVGPRPHQPREVSQYEKQHTVLFAIRPGITGMAQISGRSDLTFEEEVRLDTFYIEKWSLITDLIILLKTPFIVFKKTGAW